MDWFCYFYICILSFIMYLTFIFYNLQNGNTVGQNIREFIVSITNFNSLVCIFVNIIAYIPTLEHVII